ncbi:MAG: putative Ig domain-containing protein [Verrucomicrobiia bacterium]
MRIVVLLWLGGTVVIGGVQAQTLTDIGAANPTPGPNDIAQLSTNGNTAATTPTGKPDGLNYYTDNAAPPGQTFTTGTNSTNLIALAIRTAGLDSGGGFGTPSTTTNYYLRIYSVSGSTATLIQSYTNRNPGFTDGDWLKWNNLSVPLAANSTYAFSFGRLPAPGGWCAMAVASGNRYAGGEIALIPIAGGTMTFGGSHGYDAVFDLGMFADSPTANTPVVTPKTTVYVGQILTLTETASGTGTLSYQWQTDGGSGSLTNIPGATTTNVTVTVPSSGTFKYDIIVTNNYGSATSSVAIVTVNPPVAVTVDASQPITTMPLQGLGVCVATYDNVLINYPSIATQLKAAGIKAVRFPGGSVADVYNWQNNSGIDGQYVNGNDSFDNVMNDIVNPAGAQAIVTVNYGSNPANNAGGDTNVAAAWVAHANLTNNWGVSYWEIGNEQGGNGYYGTNLNWEYDLHYPEIPATNRVGQPALSPTAYGSNSLSFITAMKTRDPSIKCGIGFDTGRTAYNTAAEQQCSNVLDFVIIHWYPGSDAASLLASPGTIASTARNCFTQLTNNLGAAHASQMQIAVTETGGGNVTGAPVALFAADNYLTWIENGAVNVDYQILHNDILTASQQPGHAYYGAMMASLLANVGDTFVKTTSGQALLRIHATTRLDGKTGVMLINDDPLLTVPVTVSINNGTTLANTGVRYQFGLANFIGANDVPSYPVSTNTVSRLGNSFTVSVPPYAMVDLLIPPAGPNTPPVLAPIGDQTVNVGQTVAFTASATDTDAPPQTLTFTLLSGPGSATLNPNTGAFSWRPAVTDANTVNPISLMVADDGIPSLSATQSFTVTVNPLTLPIATSFTLNNGQFGFQVGGQVGPDYGVEVSTDLVNWSTLFITNSPLMPFSWVDTNAATLPAQFYRIKVGPPLP